jgi:hypothetical protein
MYPASFRSEFGEEMLWIFDEESHAGRSLPLFLDAARSIVLRRVRPRSERTATAGYYVEIDSTVPAQRVAQAVLVFLYFALGVAIVISPWVPKLKTMSHIARDGYHLTTLKIIASLPATRLPKT